MDKKSNEKYQSYLNGKIWLGNDNLNTFSVLTCIDKCKKIISLLKLKNCTFSLKKYLD